MGRTTKEVFENHLQLRKDGKLEDDIQNNYASDIVIISLTGKFHGHDGVRASARELKENINTDNFTYLVKEVEGEVAYLVWEAEDDDKKVCHGVDSFLIRDGLIQIQTIHYLVSKK